MGSFQPPLRVAILECDTPLPNTKAKFGGYGGVFQFLLKSGAEKLGRPDPEHGIKFSNHQIEIYPENYPKLEEVDALLLTGSSESLRGRQGGIEYGLIRQQGMIHSRTRHG
jgi:hypothetical protein